MNRYWLGIGAGALAVFGVGMAGISLGKKGLHELETAVAGPAAALREPIGVLRFRLDGERIGHLASLQVESDGTWGPDAVQLAVTLSDPAFEARLADCGIAGEHLDSARDDARFRCVSESDAAREGLEQVGEVRFQPGDIVRPLYVDAGDRRELERSDLRSVKASFTSDDGESVRGRAAFEVRDGHGRHERGVVSIQAGDGKALIDIRDHTGKQLFRLKADEAGVSLDASGKEGSELVRLLATSAGVSLKVRDR